MFELLVDNVFLSLHVTTLFLNINKHFLSSLLTSESNIMDGIEASGHNVRNLFYRQRIHVCPSS